MTYKIEKIRKIASNSKLDHQCDWMIYHCEKFHRKYFTCVLEPNRIGKCQCTPTFQVQTDFALQCKTMLMMMMMKSFDHKWETQNKNYDWIKEHKKHLQIHIHLEISNLEEKNIANKQKIKTLHTYHLTFECNSVK